MNEPVNEPVVVPAPPPGKEEVTYKVPFKVSIKTVFNAAPGSGVDEGSKGALKVPAFSIRLVEVRSISPVDVLTVKLPVTTKDPEMIADPV